MKSLILQRFLFSVVAFLGAITPLAGGRALHADDRPNVLWIISDDLGPELGCYGYPDVATPNVDRLAADGRLYTRAFSTSPVCSSSRSAFQTGRYQTSIACQHHLTRDKKELPDSVPTAIDLMRNAGYFISHGRGVAEDTKVAKFGVNYIYNKATIFDGHDWSQRKPGQPFFAQVHIGQPHRGFVKSEKPRSDAPIPACYPEHPVTRVDWGNYLATVEVMDHKVGAILDRLQAEGVLENTLIVFFGDHGRPHARGKQWLYDGGLHTPLIVRWPAKIETGSTETGLASLLDVMPTTLAAAGIEAPKLPGRNLLANDWQGHKMLFAARDRCGDAPDRIRSARTQRFKYIRNFHPEIPYLQLSSYKKLEYPVETLMKVLHAEGKWDSPFMASTRPKDELYDIVADPHELKNLADDPVHAQTLAAMRLSLDAWIETTGDQGAIQEDVDLDALMAEKRKWYVKTMKARGLDPDLTDEAYLKWWKQALGVTAELASPDGDVSSSLFIDDDKQLRYRVKFKGTEVVRSSALGISVDGVDLGSNVSLGIPKMSVVDESYSTRGNDHEARNHYVLWQFPVEHHPTGKKLSVQLRVYDDGVAYRYIVPSDGVQHVDGESSSWAMMDGLKAWFFERTNKSWKLKSYAGEWLCTDVNSLDTISPSGPVQGTPIVFELPNQRGYAAVTKAATYNYSGMRLKAVGNRTLVADFTEGEAGFDVEGTIVTPWRVTMLADDLNELVGSDLIKNLNPAPDPKLFADTSYIKAGRTAWSWETLGLGDPATQQTFIDLAAEMDFEYSTVDDGWKDWDAPWETVKSLCDHAKQKNVGVWLWVHSDDIRDPTNDYAQMRDYFGQVAKVGAVGLKIDFMNGESKELVDFEIAALRIAAQRKLMINFHGCHASTGEERTYPNEMTREGIRGIEVNKMPEGPLTASHNAALPFTRFIVGHADYTPILFTNPGPTTWAHQLATLVTFTTGLQTYAEHPGTMKDAPILKNAFPILQTIPSVWDETQVLDGSRIGELAAFARRSGDVWFVGILNGQQTPQDYELRLSFLPHGDYEMEVVRDDPEVERVNLVGLNPKAKLKEFTTAVPFAVTHETVSSDKSHHVELASGGGFVARLTKAGSRER
ncbi:Retaining alpha-galactosidase precursor [Planctomycetes bacterium CA13]|uniref:Retaining alpha-galactosidase n=1 Tax=Novipirellula herctigrandis TaxID=2527986 RepID=A0A5C5Z2L3_9BACT|nr:Retaining alpha-galactosidase precursor [Planctomycetes bacterium CA13]